MEDLTRIRKICAELNQLRDTLTQLSLMLKDYRANIDTQQNGPTQKIAGELLALVKQRKNYDDPHKS